MDTAKIQVQRTKKGADTVTGFPYIDPAFPDGFSTFVADENKDEFEMTAAQAAAAVLTGGFAVMKSSKSKTKADQTTLDGE